MFLIDKFELYHEKNITEYRRNGANSPMLLSPTSEHTRVLLVLRTLEEKDLEFIKYGKASSVSVERQDDGTYRTIEKSDNIYGNKKIKIKYNGLEYHIDFAQFNVEYDSYNGYTVEINGFIKQKQEISLEL